MTITMHKGDLPKNLDFGESVAVDTETLGLVPERDPLCLIQLSSGDGTAHLLQFDRSKYDAQFPAATGLRIHPFFCI
jgi:ribonuclease D